MFDYNSRNHIANKKDIRLFRKEYMSKADNHIFGIYDGAPLGVSCVSEHKNVNSNVMFFGSDTVEGRESYESYVTENLQQSNHSNIVVTQGSHFRHAMFDYVVNDSSYNPLSHLSYLYQSKHSFVYQYNICLLYSCIEKDDGTSDPFIVSTNKALFYALLCYVIESKAVTDKSLNKMRVMLLDLKGDDERILALLDTLRVFYEENPDSYGKTYYGFLSTDSSKSLLTAVMSILVQLQPFTSSCVNSVDFSEFIERKRNVLVELSDNHEVWPLYKMFFNQFINSRYLYIDSHISKISDGDIRPNVMFTQIYLSGTDVWCELIHPLIPIMATCTKYRINFSLYCDDMVSMKEKYGIEPNDIFSSCGVMIFPAKFVTDEYFCLIQKCTGVTISGRYSKGIDESALISKNDVQNFTEKDKQIVFVKGFYPIVCDLL